MIKKSALKGKYNRHLIYLRHVTISEKKLLLTNPMSKNSGNVIT